MTPYTLFFTFLSNVDIDNFVTNIFTGFSVGLGSGLANYFVFKKLLKDRESKPID